MIPSPATDIHPSQAQNSTSNRFPEVILGHDCGLYQTVGFACLLQYHEKIG
jgi:hypothetical protein